MMSIFIYVLMAKVYVAYRKPCEDDPFYNIVKNGESDFLSTENFIM